MGTEHFERRVVISGVGQSAIGRQVDRSGFQLTLDAVLAAVADAGLAVDDIDGLAMFPGGTITGCPKLRCMQIIHEQEGQARGAYTGGIGHIGWDGEADMNILIRSLWWQQGRLSWAAGAGIVADSDAEAELEEAGHKVAGLMRAFADMDDASDAPGGHDPRMTRTMA